jgi:hypothetical protein
MNPSVAGIQQGRCRIGERKKGVIRDVVRAKCAGRTLLWARLTRHGRIRTHARRLERLAPATGCRSLHAAATIVSFRFNTSATSVASDRQNE